MVGIESCGVLVRIFYLEFGRRHCGGFSLELDLQTAEMKGLRIDSMALSDEDWVFLLHREAMCVRGDFNINSTRNHIVESTDETCGADVR